MPDGALLHELQVGLRTLRYLTDHVVQGRVVAPGTFHLALLLAVAAEHWPGAPVELREVVFRRPLFVPQSGEVRLSTLLRPQGEGFAVTLSTPEGDGWAARSPRPACAP